jgi:plastocyanin
LVQTDGWSTGVLTKGETKTVKFDKPGTYYYICSPHPWMYGQVIVE